MECQPYGSSCPQFYFSTRFPEREVVWTLQVALAREVRSQVLVDGQDLWGLTFTLGLVDPSRRKRVSNVFWEVLNM